MNAERENNQVVSISITETLILVNTEMFTHLSPKGWRYHRISIPAYAIEQQ
jgi:hypothetical protein